LPKKQFEGVRFLLIR